MNSEYIVGSRNLAEEVLAANSLETNVDLVSRTVFNLARNDKHARMIFKAVEDQGFPVGIGHTIYFICACRKSLATNHELEGYSHGDLVSNLGPCGYTQPSKTEKDNQNTQTMLSHYFSFERVVIDDCRFEAFIPGGRSVAHYGWSPSWTHLEEGMKITEEQRAEILPLLQKATQASIDKWACEGAKETYVDGCEEEASS